jgi:hypothetical protein
MTDQMSKGGAKSVPTNAPEPQASGDSNKSQRMRDVMPQSQERSLEAAARQEVMKRQRPTYSRG